jgi:hypothetical protein
VVLIGQQVLGNSARRTVVPTTLLRPRPTSRRYQYIGPLPKTRARAQKGTPKPRKNKGPSTSSAQPVM